MSEVLFVHRNGDTTWDPDAMFGDHGRWVETLPSHFCQLCFLFSSFQVRPFCWTNSLNLKLSIKDFPVFVLSSLLQLRSPPPTLVEILPSLSGLWFPLYVFLFTWELLRIGHWRESNHGNGAMNSGLAALYGVFP